MTIVLVTNLVQQARRLADRTAFFSDVAADRGGRDGDPLHAARQAAHRTLRQRRVRLVDPTRLRRKLGRYTACHAPVMPTTTAIAGLHPNPRAEPLVRRLPGPEGRDVNVKPGMITALIGPSGCGKTTLLRCFNRINERYGNVTTTGEVTHPGQEHLRPRRLAQRAAEDGGHGLPAAQPAADLGLRERPLRHPRPLAPRGARRGGELDAMVESASRDVQLWDEVKDRLRRKATELTLEQQQKLCIARLLPLEPRVILMDEPCSALDAEGMERIEDLIDGLREKLHDRDRHAQHGPGPAGQPRVHFHAPGTDHRARPDARHLPQPEGARDGNVC